MFGMKKGFTLLQILVIIILTVIMAAALTPALFEEPITGTEVVLE